ncbi:MAG: DNA gyrase subunit A [Oscillospiraceae bacterium]|nr:DNA gyrase subunit A [Oscillospiraceae bacterium]
MSNEINNETQETTEKLHPRVIPVDVADEMHDSFLAYAMSVIISRALPDVRDGLKPVHRRIIYTMFENGLTPETPYRKCADTVGAVLGRYHPHGDASVNDALVRLAQDFSLRYKLVDGHGNFGSIDGDPPAAYRYTEARMSKLSLEMVADINKDTVDWASNYDDRLKEPVVLPSRYPNLLVNGSVGIAVGMATNIPTHNLGEVIDGLNLLIRNPDCTLDDLMECIKGPDFPTGGIIMGKAGIRAAYGTGRGKIIVRARTEFEEIKGKQHIIVTEIPYMVNKTRLVKHIADLINEKRIEGATFVRDESGRDGMRIVIGLRKDAIPDIVLNKLFSYTQLQDTCSVNMLVLADGTPKVLTLKQVLEHYLAFQVDVITRRTKFDLDKALKRAHLLQGFMLAADYIDEVIAILRSSSNIQEGKERLMERFQDVDMIALLERSQYDFSKLNLPHTIGLSEEQAEAIVQMRLGALTGLEQQKIMDELYEICEKISEYENILADKQKIYEIISEELGVIRRKFADNRRTEITAVSGEVDIEALIEMEDCVVTYTDKGYVKRIALDEYKTQRRGGRGVQGMKQREEDFVSEMFICSTHDNILFITNKGYMHKLKCYEIPDGSKASRGFHFANLLNLQEGEHISAMLRCRTFDTDDYVVMVTKFGRIKRTPLTAFRNINKKGIIAINLGEGDEIAGVRMTDGDEQLIVATKLGMTLRMEEKCIRPQSRNAGGVRAIRLREGDEVISMARVRSNATVLTVTTKGFGKRCGLEEYRIQGRGGYGLKNYKTDETRGTVCGIKVVDEDDDIILISTEGIIIRILASDIRVMGRTAKGVRVMKVSDGNEVVAFTRAEHDSTAETAEVEQISDEEAAQQNAEPDEIMPEVEPDDEE